MLSACNPSIPARYAHVQTIVLSVFAISSTSLAAFDWSVFGGMDKWLNSSESEFLHRKSWFPKFPWFSSHNVRAPRPMVKFTRTNAKTRETRTSWRVGRSGTPGIDAGSSFENLRFSFFSTRKSWFSRFLWFRSPRMSRDCSFFAHCYHLHLEQFLIPGASYACRRYK